MSRFHLGRRHRTLYGRVLGHGVRLLLAVSIALGFAGFLFGQHAAWRPHPASLAKLVGNLVAPLPDSALSAQLQAFAKELEVDIAVFRDDGEKVAEASDGGWKPLGPTELRQLRSQSEPRRTGPLAVAFPAGPDRYGRLVLRVSHAALLLRGLGFLGLLVLALSLASVPLARAIARPVEQLTRAARRLGEGDLQARAGLAAGDEIGDLGRSFDEMAERLSKLLEGHRDLLASVSHELRTPLTRLRVSLALASEAGPEQAPRHLQDMEHDLAELEQLVADLLTSSRLDAAGALALRREPASPSALLETAAARFERTHPDWPLSLSQAGSDPPPLSCEPELLGRALDNLLDNAAKYSDPGSPIQLSLEENANGDGVTIRVRDRGLGMSAEDASRAFTPFFRADRSRTRDSGGVGLGLALCKRIVEAHGGRIALESQLQVGTTITLTLPRSAPSN